MIRHLILTFVLLQLAYAFHVFKVPPIIRAGRPFHVRLTSDASLDRELPNYSLFLAVPWTSVGWADRPVCVLANLSAISSLVPINPEQKLQNPFSLNLMRRPSSNNTNPINNDDTTPHNYQHPDPLTIPSSIGESSPHYAIMATRFLTPLDSRWEEPPNLVVSNRFTLQGATARWSRFETEPGGPLFLGFADRLPCEAYDCARGCHDRWFPLNVARRIGRPVEEGGVSERTAWRAMSETHGCVAACPGVRYLSFEEMYPMPDWWGAEEEGAEIQEGEERTDDGLRQDELGEKEQEDAWASRYTDAESRATGEAGSEKLSAIELVNWLLRWCIRLPHALMGVIYDVVACFKGFLHRGQGVELR